MNQEIKRCLICKQELDVPGKPETADCGGDCCRCMAEAGDTDCQRALGWTPNADGDLQAPTPRP